MSKIKVIGARHHNLKNISVEIPKNKLVVITGVSGSGKSTLAFDVLYAEGQRRYVESLSSYARQFLGVMQKPEVERIEGITPAIAIEQRSGGHNPRSTVGTVTEIYDYLRVLFARIGTFFCPNCNLQVKAQSVQEIINKILDLKGKEIAILAPLVEGRKGEHRQLLEEIEKAGFVRVRINGELMRIKEALETRLDKRKQHTLEVLVDRMIIKEKPDTERLTDSVELGLKVGRGKIKVSVGEKELLFSEKNTCPKCGLSLPELEPRLFSFNSPFGACPECQGLGEKLIVSPDLVIPNPALSINQGAIEPWSRASHRLGRQGYFWWRLQELADRLNFSLHTPFKELPERVKTTILWGDEWFEGVIPFLERRYRETESDYTKEEIRKYMVEEKCRACGGQRLRKEALSVKVAGHNIFEITSWEVEKALRFFKGLTTGKDISQHQKTVAKPLLKEIVKRLGFLQQVGLSYLTLSRKFNTLSGGEAQRVRLATQLGSQLSGVLYVLDEPSIGLHPRDHERLLKALRELKELENTVVVVEHDFHAIKQADWVIDLGPGAGQKGGKVVFEGTPNKLRRANTLTALYFSGKKQIEVERKQRKPTQDKYLIVKGAVEHNLKNITVKIPLGLFVVVSGVSGSGKSTLCQDILAKALKAHFYQTRERPGKHKEIKGLEHIDKVVLVDQSPIGRTPRSNPATYTGVFSLIRELFAKTREARLRGWKAGRFSFNVKGGRCEECRGEGMKKIEMYFLPDLYIECPVCKGRRYNEETLKVLYKGKNIAEVLDMTVDEAKKFFENIPGLARRLGVLQEVGLGYIKLGQPAPTLSGGEAQRVKLALELSKVATGRTLYILDEPTTGLHPSDIEKLLRVLHKLVDRGNTVLVTEHNLDVIKTADWIIELGPEGGEKGGKIVFEGTVQDMISKAKTPTAEYLKKYLAQSS